MLNIIIFRTLIRVVARKLGLETSDIHELPNILDELERTGVEKYKFTLFICRETQPPIYMPSYI